MKHNTFLRALLGTGAFLTASINGLGKSFQPAGKMEEFFTRVSEGAAKNNVEYFYR